MTFVMTTHFREEIFSYLDPRIWVLVLNETTQYEKFSMLLYLESKGGSPKDVHGEYARYFLSKWGLYLHNIN